MEDRHPERVEILKAAADPSRNPTVSEDVVLIVFGSGFDTDRVKKLRRRLGDNVFFKEDPNDFRGRGDFSGLIS